MKKVFLIGALALGMMSFTETYKESQDLNCFSNAMWVYNIHVENGASHELASAYSNMAFNNCMASIQ